jgi:hypothetical protein
LDLRNAFAYIPHPGERVDFFPGVPIAIRTEEDFRLDLAEAIEDAVGSEIWGAG